MKRGAIISAILHLFVIAFAYFGLPTLFDPPQVKENSPMSVDIVVKEEKQKQSLKPAELKEVPKSLEIKQQPVQTPQKPNPSKKVAPKITPKLASPPPKLKPKPKPKPKPKQIKKTKKKALKRPQRIAPKPKQKPSRPDEFRKLLKDLTKRKKTESQVVKTIPKIKTTKPTQIQTAYLRREAENALIESVREQVVPCWHIPGGSKDAQKMKIMVRIKLNRDGTLIAGFPRVVDKFRFKTDRSFRVVAESAIRALHRCSPLDLPYRDYKIWNDITFKFDPSEALAP
ncbi:MAG: hypothetical protein VX434_05555 [Pseudomonadota bacterium]|nr:hypothetical protein [Pseudomonadota bacterium]